MSGNGFGDCGARVVFVEKSLTLQIGRLDEIPVENPYAANARANEEAGGGSTDRAAADDNGARGKKAPLALVADASKEHLARVLFTKRIVQERARHLFVGHRPS